MRRRRRDYLFQQGSRAALCIGYDADAYPCPICGNLFAKADLDSSLLTEEHVPPKFMGGKSIILTCASCNNSAGSRLEAQLKDKFEQQRQAKAIVLDTIGDAGHVYLSADGVLINATLSNIDGRKHFKIDSTFNDTAKVEAFARYLEAGADLKVTSKFRYFEKLAQLAELKSVYLLLTAKFGYTLAFSKAGNFVRYLINDQGLDQVPLRYFEPSEGSEFTGIAFDKSSKTFYMNISGRYVSIIWDIEEMKNFRRDAKPNERVTFAGPLFPFPTSFEAVLDHKSDSKMIE